MSGSPERRLTPRCRLMVPMAFHRIGTLFDGESPTRTINISIEGVYFSTHLTLNIGERLELAFRVPKRITGIKSKSRQFTGRVTRIDLMPHGLLGIGVQLLCYETPRREPQAPSSLSHRSRRSGLFVAQRDHGVDAAGAARG